jgi:hypothetical protein
MTKSPICGMTVDEAKREMERLISAAQRHWLLRNYVNKTNPSPLRPLVGVAEPAPKPVKAFRSPKESAR